MIEVLPAQMLPELTRSATGVEEAGHTECQWATGTRIQHKWAEDESRERPECYYTCNPSGRVYMKRKWNLWILHIG